MVAIVSGNSLGLDLTSLGVLGSGGAWGSAAQGNSGEQVYVNAATGNLVVQRLDDGLASHGLDNRAVRTYNSLGLLNDDNYVADPNHGDNWSLGIYAKQLELSGTRNTVGSTLKRTGYDGSVALYNWDTTRSCYITQDGAGAHDTIVYNSTSLQYERTDGSSREVEKYSSAGQLVSVTDADGNTSTYSYNSAGLLTLVKDRSEGTVSYTYDPNNPKRLTSITAKYKNGTDANGIAIMVTSSSVSYGYDSFGRLNAVTVDLTPQNTTDSSVYTTNYTYVTASATDTRIYTLTQSDGSSLTFTYDANKRVQTITDALGSVTTFSYGTSRTTVSFGTVAAPIQQTWYYDYNTSGQLTKVTSPNIVGSTTVTLVQNYSYDADGNVLSITNGEGEKVTMTYDANGNQLSMTDAEGNTVNRTYSASNQLMAETVASAATPVMINQSGISIVGSDIVKTGGTDGTWDSSVRSSGGLTGGASVGFQAGQTDKGVMVGLTADPGANHSFGTIDYALYCTEGGNLFAYENGTSFNLNATYTANDKLRVTYDGSKVIYLKGDVVLRTVLGSISDALYVDTSFKQIGAKVTNLSFGESATSSVPLLAESNATISDGGTVVKTSTFGVSSWDASVRSLSGYTGSAFVSFKAGQTNKSFMVGLNSDASADDSYSSLDYAMYCVADGTLCAYEDGHRVDFDPATPTYAATDTLKVIYTGSKVQYIKVNSAGATTVLREVTVAISGPLYLDSSLASLDARIDSLKFGKSSATAIAVMAAAKESGLVIASDAITKRGGTDGAWDSSSRSELGYVGQANVSFSPTQTDKGYMVGLNTDPDTNRSGYGDLDYAFYIRSDGKLEVREGGVDINVNRLSSAVAYAAGDRLQISYDGSTIRYLKNGVVLRSVAVVINDPLFIDTSFRDVGAAIANLRFSDRATPDLTTRYIYSASKPTQLHYVLTPEGRVTQYKYNSYGERIAKITYPGNAYNMTNVSPDTVLDEGDLDTWVTGLGTDLSGTVREDYQYDARGLLTYLNQYEKTNTSGSGDTSTLRQTHYIYDESGRLLQAIQPGGSTGDQAGSPTTTYTYDGLGRVLTVTAPNGATTSTVYTDSAQKAVITYQSGAVATSIYDKAGRLLTYTRTNTSITKYVYDAFGRVVMTQTNVGSPPVAVRNFNVYDEAGRKVATVDANGTLTETTYDKAGRVTRVYTYATAVDLAAMVDVNGVPTTPKLADIRPTAVSADLQSWNVYDDAGRLVYEIAETGAVIQHDYDGAGRMVRTLRYSVAIATTATPTLNYIKAQLAEQNVEAGAAADRAERLFYDADGLLAGKLDAEGYLTTFTYDKAGRLVHTHRYANAVPEAERAGGGSLTQLSPTTDVKDQFELNFYDARGLLVYSVDSERYVTKNTYDYRGLLATQTRYAAKLSTMPWWTDDISTQVAALADAANDRTSSYYYQLDGQLLKTTDFEGVSTFYEYDDSGRLITKTQGYGRADKRVSQYRYDAWGRKVQELSGEASAEITADMTQAEIDSIWATDGIDYYYDALDRLRKRVDANGLATAYYYDDDSRLAYTVNAYGEVEQNVYNALGLLTSTIRYATRIAADKLATLVGGPVVQAFTDLVVADPVNDSRTSHGYDGAGREINTIDGEGAVTSTSYNLFDEIRQRLVPWQGGTDLNVDKRQDTFAYDRRGLLVQGVYDAMGVASTTATGYDAFGRATSVTKNGKTVTTDYDDLGRVVLTINPLNKSVVTTYDAFGQVLTVTDELNKVTTYSYNRAARQITMTTPEGVSVITTRTAYGETYSIQDGNGVLHYSYYDHDGRLTQNKVKTGPLPTDWVYEYWDYDNGGRLKTSTDRRGVVTSYTYDAANRVFTRTVDSGGLALKTTWTYDAKGQIYTVKDPRGTITQYAFDLAGHKTQQIVDTAGLKLTTDWTYDAQGNVLTVKDPNRVTTQYVFDKLGRRKSETIDPTGLAITRHYDYDQDGNVIVAYDALDNATRYGYDNAGRLRFTIDAEGGLTYNEYTDTGKLKRQTRYASAWTSANGPTSRPASGASDQVTRYVYDGDGRLHYTIDAVGGLTRTRYDANGNVTAVTRYATAWTSASDPTDTAVDALADATVDRTDYYTYDAFNRQQWHADATGAFTLNEYDENGNITRVTQRSMRSPGTDPMVALPASDPLDRVTDYQYDNANRLTYTVDPMGYVRLNGYDKNGNVTSIVRYVTQVADRAHPENVHVDTTVYGDRTQGFTYDAANRVKTVTDALGAIESFTYDANGNKKTYTNKNLDVWSYDYDKANRLETETSPAVALWKVVLNDNGTLTQTSAGTAPVVTKLTYDDFGNLKTRTEAYGRDEARTTTYEYDKLNRQVKVTYPSLKVHAETAAELAANTRLGDAVRDEVSKAPFTQTWYDQLGNAVSSVDRNGNASFKAYDAAGRVKYEVDALGYITEYGRNAFGEATTQTRYFTASSLAGTAPNDNDPGPTLSEIATAVAVAGFVTASDRTLTTGYDKCGRVIKVTEPSAYSYNSSTGRAATYAKQTASLYNAFGELIRMDELLDVDTSANPDTLTWRYTYHYYDNGGRKTATADAAGYLTTFDYDSEGNLKEQVEYSNKMTVAWNASGYTLPTADADHDRTTTWTWDKLNRKVSEVKHGVNVYSSSTTTSVFTVATDLVTSFGYDDVGNQIWVKDAAGGITRSYYDELGRVRAVVAPSRSSTVDGSALLPLVEFRRDAHGNVLVKIERVASALDVTSTDFTSVYTAGVDRFTTTLYDASGNALQTTDARGFQHYNSYYADGKLAKSWQTVTDNDEVQTTLYAAYYYDKLGRLKDSYAPSPVAGNTVSTNYEYNAFGEVVTRGKNGLKQEYFAYDNAGRMWKTNTGDGYATVYLYDLLGRQTAEISSAGSGRSGAVDVETATSASQAAAWTSTRRINIKYNVLGHVVERQEAERLVIEGGVTIRKGSANASIAGSSQFTADYSSGGESGPTQFCWTGSNSISLSWTTLAYLGSGDVRVDLTYKTQESRYLMPASNGDGVSTPAYYTDIYGGSPPVTRTESQIFAGYQGNTGLTMSWTGTSADRSSGIDGISTIDRVVVYKRNINGDWVKVIDRDPAAGRAFGDYGTQVEIGSPVDPTTAVSFKYRVSGTTDWIIPALSKFGDSHWFDASTLSGTYEYEVWLTPKDGTAEKTESGTFVAKANDSDDSAMANAWERPIVYFTRDRWGNVLSQSDPRNKTWKTFFTYDENNQVTSEKRPDPTNGDQTDNSPTRNIYYDKLGRQRAIQDERGFVNTSEWDAGGNLTREVHADGGKVTYFYDAFGQRVQMVDAIGNTTTDKNSVTYQTHTTTYVFDRLGRQLSTTHGSSTAGAVTKWHVDGNLNVVNDGKQNLRETFTYDEAGRKLSQSNGASELTQYWYDRAGNVIKTMLPGGQYSTTAYDFLGHKTSESDANAVTGNGIAATWSFDYFGQLKAHKDIGGATYTYLYDTAGQLTDQTNTRGQNLHYGYDAAGQLITVNDVTLDAITATRYDLAGHHLREKVSKRDPIANAYQVFQDNHLSYDTLGRMIDSADDRAHLTFQYDKAGNRTRITTHVYVATVGDDDVENVKDSTRYFVYDEMSRQTSVDAVDDVGTISSVQGHTLTYDLNGNRVTDVFWGNQVKSTTNTYYTRDPETWEVTYTNQITSYTKTSGYVQETYGYDAYGRLLTVDRDGTLVDQRWYDGAGRVVQSGPTSLPTAYTDKLNEGVAAEDQIGMELRRQIYDVNGRMTFQRAFRSDGTIKYDIAYQGVDRNGAALGYDAAGNVKAYEFRNAYGGAYKNTSTITLARFEGYVEQKTVTTTNKANTGTGTSTSTFDANGFLIGVDDNTENTLDKTITNDAAGRVLRVTQNGNNLYSSIVNGEVMGKFGIGPNEVDPRTSKNQANFQQVAEFGFGYRSITGSYPAPSVGSYTVRQGDSLQAIAQAAFGDSSQWWRIAQANGLQSDRDLRVGQTLTLPTAVAGATNDASTFKPYNPSDVVGDTSPNLPQPKADKGCGAVGMIIMVVVMVVVTIYTAGALSTVAGATFAETMAAGAATLAGTGTVAAASVAGSMGLGMTGTAMAVGAISAAAGSLASQLVGVAMGQTKFSWKQVAQSSASGAVSAGLGAEFGSASMAGSGMQNTVVRSAVSNAMTQGVSVAAGLQDHFSWTSVAAAAAGSMMGQAIGAAGQETLGTGHVAKLVTGTLAGIASAATVAEMRGGKFSMQQAATDAFGNALGSSIADQVSAPSQIEGQAQTEDSPTGGSGLRFGGGGSSLRLSAGAVADWSGQVDQGIASSAAALRGDWTSGAASGYVSDDVVVNDDGSSPNAVGGREGDLLAANAVGARNSHTGGRLTMVPRELSALSDPAVRADPEALRRLYNVARENSRAWLPTSLSPEEISLTTGVAYQKVFGEDRTAIWFGLAPYATSKVGETYQQLDKVGLLDLADTGIIRSGFREGNRAIFESMFTAEQFYQAGGTEAIRAMVALDNKSFGANWTRENLAYAHSLVESFELRDQAKVAFAAGETGRGEEFLGQSLRASADFEQRAVLQQYYDQSYTANGETKTLRQAIQDAFKLDNASSFPSKGFGWGSDPSFRLGEAGRGFYNSLVGWASERASTVTINGKSLSFNGTDVGDVNQRMPFVYSLAGNLMSAYSSDGNWLSGSQRIYQDQFNVLNKTYGPDAVTSVRQRLGFER